MSDSLSLRIMKTLEVTIEANTSISDAVRLNGWKIARIKFPDAWTAANITFQESYDGETYANAYDSSGEISISVTAGVSRAFSGETLLPAVKYLKVRSGTAVTPVAQSAERVITLICTP